jgi:vacuolar protein 8
MGGGASSMQHRLHKLSADSVQQLVESIGPSFVDIAKQLRESGFDGEFLDRASDEDLNEIFDELKVPKMKRKLLRQKLAKLKEVTSSTGSLGTRTMDSGDGGRAGSLSTLWPIVPQIPPEDVTLEPQSIGQGGYSIVFKGAWNQQGTFGRAKRSLEIAAKRSRVAGLGADIQADLIKDLMVMSEVPHQNVLIVYGSCDIPDLGFHVVTELMAHDLDDVIHQNVRGSLADQDVLHIARDVAAGLAHLHASRIIHRDLKPSNVLVAGGHGIIRCKIADFGISKALTHTLTQMTKRQGTCMYMAPESLADGGNIGTSADAYAYGVLAWELLTRKKPWAGKDEHQIHNALVRGERLSRPDAPVVPELADWAVDCFKEPDERPKMGPLEVKLDGLLCSDERDLRHLRLQLAAAQRGDADAFDAAWEAYAQDPHCKEMLELCARLAKNHATTPQQPESCKTVEDLLSLAKGARDGFHDALGDLIKSAVGAYVEGPTKTRERCVEKMDREYDGEIRRVVDVERATALFTTVSALHEGLRQLSHLTGGNLEVVRVKDNFSEPKESGWRCVYLSLKHVPSGLIGELQITFNKIKEINARSHPIYNLVRCLEHGVEPAARAPQVRTRAPTPSNPITVVGSIDDAELAAFDGDFGPLIFFLKDGTAEGAMKRAAAALSQSAADTNNSIAIVKQGAVPPLIDVLRGGSADAKEQAARALWNLSVQTDHQVSIFEAGAAAPLIDILASSADDAKAAAAGVLSNLAWNNNDIRAAIVKAGAVPPLIDVLRNGTDEGKTQAAGAFRKLALNTDNKISIAKAGAIAPLIYIVETGTAKSKSLAARALWTSPSTKTTSA